MSCRVVLGIVLGLMPAWAPVVAQQPAAAAGFQRVLWVSAEQASDPAYLGRVKAAGFQAINLRPGADPGPVIAAGLGFYLDQPAGKGYLELRDADWAPVRNGYEQKRDPALLKRPTCLQDPDLLAATAARSVAAAKALQGPLLRFVAIADEASATRHNQPLDVCRCEACRQALLAFLRGRHGTVQKLNEAWGTEFADWNDVTALTTDQVRRRELGGTGFPNNLRPYSEVLEFVDGQFAHAVARITADVQAAVPGVPVGLTGIQAPMAFGGHDYARLLPSQTLIEPYDTGGALALARCLRPAADCYATLHAPTDEANGSMLLTAKLSSMAAHGLRGAVVWNGDTVLGDKASTPFAERLTAAFAATQAALDACAGAELTYSDVWLVESQASVRAWWMLDSAADGMTWVRRMPSHEATHSSSLAVRRSWTKLLGDLGITPRFVPESALPERLLQQRPRLLVLPGTIALGDRSCQAITAYVQNGGALLADHSPALYDEHLRLRAHPALDELFGIQARSHRLADLRVREGSLLGKGAVVAEAGLRGRLGEERAVEPVQGEIGESGLEVRSQREGSEQVFLEFRPGKGRAIYLNLPVCLYDRQRLDAAAGGAAQDLRRRVRQVLQTVFALPPFGVRGEGLPVFLHRTVLQTRSGRRIFTLRLDVEDQPQLLQQLARNPARTVQCTFARPVHLRTLRGEDLGTKDRFELPFDVLAGLFVIEGDS